MEILLFLSIFFYLKSKMFLLFHLILISILFRIRYNEVCKAMHSNKQGKLFVLVLEVFVLECN